MYEECKEQYRPSCKYSGSNAAYVPMWDCQVVDAKLSGFDSQLATTPAIDLQSSMADTDFIELLTYSMVDDPSSLLPTCLHSQSPPFCFDNDENNNFSPNIHRDFLNSSLDSSSSSHEGSDCDCSGWSMTSMSSSYPCYPKPILDDDDESVMLDDDEDDQFLRAVDQDEQNASMCKNYAYNWRTNECQYRNPMIYPEQYTSHNVVSDSYPTSSPCRAPDPHYPNLPKFHDLIDTDSPSYPSVRRHYSGSCDEDSDSDSEADHTPRKGKRGSKSILLWKFLLDSLADSQYAPQILKWENKASGIFKFVDTTAVAKLWGSQKRKGDMNFEKLSRGIRHYYRSGMMKRVEGKRLVYKFNWKMIPKDYRKKSFIC